MKFRYIAIWAIVFFAGIAKDLRADFSAPIVKKIPLYRLVVNLEKQKENDPSDPQIYYALGRLYAMAYSMKSDSMEAVIKKGEDEFSPFYGFNNLKLFSNEIKSSRDSNKARFYGDCLNRSIANFRFSLRLDSDFVPARLGLAWSLQHKGFKKEAIQLYRNLIKSESRSNGSFSSIEASEAAGYLINLLDKGKKDKDEIESLSGKIKNYKPSFMVSPILIPMESYNKFDELIDTSVNVKFDLDGSGVKKEWQWLSKKAGWLVFSKDNNPVENAFQLFGSVSFNIHWANGFEALKSLDDNWDGVINGKELSGLSIWLDKNQDGISQPDELFDIKQTQIEQLTYKYEKFSDRILLSKGGIQYKNGTTSDYFDWFPKNKIIKPGI